MFTYSGLHSTMAANVNSGPNWHDHDLFQPCCWLTIALTLTDANNDPDWQQPWPWLTATLTLTVPAW